MSVDLEKIKTRYRRLLAMSGDVNSPHEAAIAARRAASLMHKYDLDEADCADGSPEDAWTVDDFVGTFAELRQKRAPQWITSLVIRVARLHGCEVRREWCEEAQAHRLQWLGTVADALAAEMCLDYLIQQVNQLAKIYQAGGQRTRMEMTDFRTGATAEISRTIDQIVEDQETAHAANTGDPGELMVVSKRQAIRARFDVRYGTRRGRAVGDGYATGKAAAKGVGVRRSVHGSGGPAGYLH